MSHGSLYVLVFTHLSMCVFYIHIFVSLTNCAKPRINISSSIEAVLVNKTWVIEELGMHTVLYNAYLCTRDRIVQLIQAK
jgi:hypothetical protein